MAEAHSENHKIVASEIKPGMIVISPNKSQLTVIDVKTKGKTVYIEAISSDLIPHTFKKRFSTLVEIFLI
jgi:hypothetical protein